MRSKFWDVESPFLIMLIRKLIYLIATPYISFIFGLLSHFMHKPRCSLDFCTSSACLFEESSANGIIYKRYGYLHTKAYFNSSD